jgi:hypothetical protein
MTWPPGVGISSTPRLGSSDSQRAAFKAYTAAFSAAQTDLFPKFYTEDVVLTLPSQWMFHGRQAITEFYTKMFGKIRESLEIEQLITDDEGICAKFWSTFTAVEDSAEYFGDFKKGSEMKIHVAVLYKLHEGLISSIDVARLE